MWDYENSEALRFIKTRDIISESGMTLNADLTRVMTSMTFSQQRTGVRVQSLILRDVMNGESILHSISGDINVHFTQFLFSPTNPELFISIDQHGSARFWNVNQGVELFALNSPDYPVTIAVFSPDGEQLATAGADNQVRLWRVSDGTLLETFDNQSTEIQRLHINANGQILAFSDPHNIAEVWDVQTGATIATFQIDQVTPPLLNARFNPATEQIVTVDTDSTIHLWQPDLSEETIAIPININDRNGVAISNDGNLIAVMNIVSGQVQILDIQQLATPITFQLQPVHRIDAFGFSPDGGQLLISTFGDGSPLIANPSIQRLTGLTQLLNLGNQSSAHKTILVENNIYAFAFSPVQPLILYGVHNQLQQQDLQRKTTVTLYNQEERWFAANMTFSPDGNLLAVKASTSISLWDTRTWTVVQQFSTLPGGSSAKAHLTFSPDGTLLIVAAGKILQIYDVVSGRLLNQINAHVDDISSVTFNVTGSLIMTSSLDGTIRLWGLP